MEQKHITLSKWMTREHSLFYAHVWMKANKDCFDKRIVDKGVQNLVFKLNDKGVLEVYYDLEELDSISEAMVKAFNCNPEILDELILKFYNYWKKISPYLSEKKGIQSISELKEFYSNWIEWWDAMGYLFIVPDQKNIAEELRQKALKPRVETQEFSGAGDNVFINFVKNKYPKYASIAQFLTPEEAFRLDSISEKEVQSIKEREKGYALVILSGESKLITLKNLDLELRKNNLSLEEIKEKKTNEIKGLAASPGLIRGKVRVILKKSDLTSLEKGEIMVTYATSPEYVPAMKKSAGIITDEGGIVCHASIVSRELGIPCVVGTKVGTQILKNGMDIELNATKGIIKILERKST